MKFSSYNSEAELDFYFAVFQNKTSYNHVTVKSVLPIVSKLGIMSRTGTVKALPGSINFGQPVDSSRPSQSSIYRKPKRLAGLSQVAEEGLPKTVVAFEEFSPERVSERKMNSYTKQELTDWYERFTGTRPNPRINLRDLGKLVLLKYEEQTKA